MEKEIRTLKKHQKEADTFKKQVAKCNYVETGCKTGFTIFRRKKHKPAFLQISYLQTTSKETNLHILSQAFM